MILHFHLMILLIVLEIPNNFTYISIFFNLVPTYAIMFVALRSECLVLYATNALLHIKNFQYAKNTFTTLKARKYFVQKYVCKAVTYLVHTGVLRNESFATIVFFAQMRTKL